eukprot:TRINITY_DN8927_c0_g1_i1.p1 TRINITY_DN8927_c0_g1~~TRINITY_DN8927_c0_g1_i1.p1  ORF type:complete len:386 (-),score=-11.35 TRINITY_DN8927_c0_g1_i1:95-1252(-)
MKAKKIQVPLEEGTVKTEDDENRGGKTQSKRKSVWLYGKTFCTPCAYVIKVLLLILQGMSLAFLYNFLNDKLHELDGEVWVPRSRNGHYIYVKPGSLNSTIIEDPNCLEQEMRVEHGFNEDIRELVIVPFWISVACSGLSVILEVLLYFIEILTKLRSRKDDESNTETRLSKLEQKLRWLKFIPHLFTFTGRALDFYLTLVLDADFSKDCYWIEPESLFWELMNRGIAFILTIIWGIAFIGTMLLLFFELCCCCCCRGKWKDNCIKRTCVYGFGLTIAMLVITGFYMEYRTILVYQRLEYRKYVLLIFTTLNIGVILNLLDKCPLERCICEKTQEGDQSGINNSSMISSHFLHSTTCRDESSPLKQRVRRQCCLLYTSPSPRDQA